MGLSAGQAKLLSLTARLTDNEYRSQNLSNARMRLATASNDARMEYQNALNSEQLNFLTYDSTGSSVATALTPNVLYQYQPMKSQYSLVNSAGQVLVSPKDAKNFEESETLQDFLAKYDLMDGYEAEVENYKTEYAQYVNDLQDYNIGMAKYLEVFNDWYESAGSHSNLYDIFIDAVGKSATEMSEQDVNSSCYARALYYHYSDNSQRTGLTCYQHVLAGLLDFDGYTDSNGNRSNTARTTLFQVPYSVGDETHALEEAKQYLVGNYGADKVQPKDDNAATYYVENDDGSFIRTINDNGAYSVAKMNYIATCDSSGNTGVWSAVSVGDMALGGFATSGNSTQTLDCFKRISKTIREESKLLCDGNDSMDIWDKTKHNFTNMLEYASNNGQTITPLMRLLSDFVEVKDENGNLKLDENGKQVYEVKTLRQKAIDMYYVITSISGFEEFKNKNLDSQLHNVEIFDGMKLNAFLTSFTEGDLLGATDGPDLFNYVKTEDPPTEPQKPNISVEDQEKAQWYINLWFRMNGETESLKSQASTKENADGSSTTKYIIDDIATYLKKEGSGAYKVLNTGLANSENWLKDALTQGIVTMEKIAVDRLEPDFKMNWNGTIYSNVSEIVSRDNDKARAIAEAKYEKALQEIEIKDKKYQNDISRLDTEHNALQTEYDSVKSEVEKNIDRSYKVFQG